MLKRLARGLAALALFYCLFSQSTFAQQDSLNSLTKKFDNYWSQNLPEKIFVHANQTFLLTGETLWFNVFLVDGLFHRPNDLSKVVYLEVIDKDNVSVLKTKISMSNGSGNGNLFIPSSLSSGKYYLVAYTRWMRNFSPHSYFHQSITIVNPFVPLSTPSKSEQSSYDIQFFPEGGNLVVGLPSTVAYRVVGKDGIGIYFKGAILNKKNDTITRITPLKFGLGKFRFTPKDGEQYIMVFVDSHKQKIITPIPAAYENGFVLRLKDSVDFIEVEVQSKFQDASAKNQWVYLFAQSRQMKTSSLALPLNDGKTNFIIDKKKLKEGVNHFTLFDHQLRPVCERIFFKNPEHNLQIKVKSDLGSYATREKIELNFVSQTADGHPTNPNMSVSVYRIDSLEQDEPINISTYFWLTSELKGTIESPGYYLYGNPDQEAVDNLMLTHGWSRFKWEDILSNQSPRIPISPEYGGHLFTGHVLDRDGNRASGINTYFSIVGKDGQLSLSRSNAHGDVTYEAGNIFGKHRVVAQVNSEIDSTFKIELDEEYADVPETISIPDFHLSEEKKAQLTQRNLAMQLQHSFDKQNHNQATIANDSLPFYGVPTEAYKLDDFTRFPTMEEVLREYVSGVMVRKKKNKFHFLTLDRSTNTLFKDNPLVMLDGAPIFNLNKIMEYDPRKIQKIDVVTKRYYLGHLAFDGLVNCITYQGNLKDFNPDFATVLTVDGLQPQREFFSPRYETKLQKESRIPDKRHLLHWSPSVISDSQGKSNLTFYSSDVPGTYQVIVQGLSENGEFGSAVAEFQVKP